MDRSGGRGPPNAVRARFMSLCSKNKRKAILGDPVSLRAVLAQEEQGACAQLSEDPHPGTDMRPGTGDSKNVAAKLLDETDVCSSIHNFLRNPL